MLRSRFVLASFGFAALALAACGNAADGTGGAGGGGGTGGGGAPPSGPGVQPPEADPAAPEAEGADTVLAIRRLQLGDTNQSGSPSSTAWKDLGYDLDKKISTKDSTDLCAPAEGAKGSDVYPDGTDGIDNSFGANILPIITSLASDASTQINNSIEGGSFTIMLRSDKLGTGDGYNGIFGKLYGGSKLVDAMGMEIPPKWDGTDEWPVIAELLEGGDIEKPLVQFPKAYVVKNPETGARTWVSGGYADIQLNLSVAGFTLGLTIRNAVITMDLADDNTKATNGIIAGILNTQQLIDELAKVAGSFDPSLCPPSSTFESIAQQIRQASDIPTEGDHDPKVECDGISIGLGFEMQQVKLGAVSDPATPGEDPCTPAP